MENSMALMTLPLLSIVPAGTKFDGTLTVIVSVVMVPLVVALEVTVNVWLLIASPANVCVVPNAGINPGSMM